jgi:hypothetical protein
MLPMGKGPGFGPFPPHPLHHGTQGQSTNPSQMYPTQFDAQGHTLPHANHMPAMYSPQPANPPLTQMYLSQPTNLSYFPPNQEQYLNMR